MTLTCNCKSTSYKTLVIIKGGSATACHDGKCELRAVGTWLGLGNVGQ
jgi:hypothetical protein